jgi:hypothetical protein
MILSHYERAIRRDAVPWLQRQISQCPFNKAHKGEPVEPFSIPFISYIGGRILLSFVDS